MSKVSEYCYANVPDQLSDINTHMEIWLGVNCCDLYDSRDFTNMKNTGKEH